MAISLKSIMEAGFQDVERQQAHVRWHRLYEVAQGQQATAVEPVSSLTVDTTGAGSTRRCWSPPHHSGVARGLH